ncbi:Farnesyl diphosphate synthase,geranyltranstransferase,Geranylgeranyl pyrophosphate synthase,heptaprenyl diphosphate synthase component II,Polyprenyl synthetase [Chlamydia poikilotherma]|uniref:Farnesyl diphosphate synthase,geranyltranstransferase,Geranylgeranyl pyrophosphate synthase,heptaprenyl diphosphate synthase component II,Polyprenyl synthetase n=1 Tax=Chlamydia poikilotherma TaxID=1967783 RepID=A0A3B0PNQ4_9CHLA|nr:polyprenyl synthetase family protein [Chlamydia poikilotherma]SYX09469.1 Farnesyl diphosphate synthase,geranyltranstransferase,Geranylgeranyl pyrophosphate synthase,heptaprenyl diphosphate synthase component II,Polyprenyl synthetase [Chlamydia poikilotherma]
MVVMDIFETYRVMIEEGIESSLEDFGSKGLSVRAPVEYSLTSGGKRIRPMLVCMIAKGLGMNRDVLDSALAIEFIHTSTLIADDLPCMDDDDERRGRPTVHKAFDEASALLASYALIPSAYSRIRLNAKKLKSQGIDPREVDIAYDIISDVTDKNFGVNGVLGGQYEDMFFKNEGPEYVQLIINKKTGALFEIACVSGWLFGGGDPLCVPQIIEFSQTFGLLFQMKDDILDMHQDRQDVGLNYALLFGLDAAKELLNTSMDKCIRLLNHLKQHGLKDSSELEMLIEYMGVRDY